MTAIASSARSERAVAAAVLLTAITIALWIALHRTPEVPPRALPTERAPRAEAPPPQSARARPASPAALAFEIAELPPMPAPHAVQQSVQQAVAQPQPRAEPPPVPPEPAKSIVPL